MPINDSPAYNNSKLVLVGKACTTSSSTGTREPAGTLVRKYIWQMWLPSCHEPIISEQASFEASIDMALRKLQLCFKAEQSQAWDKKR
jgi:hypothetical protein